MRRRYKWAALTEPEFPQISEDGLMSSIQNLNARPGRIHTRVIRLSPTKVLFQPPIVANNDSIFRKQGHVRCDLRLENGSNITILYSARPVGTLRYRVGKPIILPLLAT